MAIDFRERVERLREIANLTATDLDELAGLSHGHTRLIELGRRSKIEARTVSKLAATFGVSMDWLYVGTGHEPSERSVRTAIGKAQARLHVAQSTGTDG